MPAMCRSPIGKDVKKREDELISSEGGACCSAN